MKLLFADAYGEVTLYSAQERETVCAVLQQGWRSSAVLSRRGSVRTLVRMQNIAGSNDNCFLAVAPKKQHKSSDVRFNRHCEANKQWI